VDIDDVVDGLNRQLSPAMTRIDIRAVDD